MIGEIEKVHKAGIAIEPSSKPVSAEERAKLLIDPGFGRVFTDHMAIIEYDEEDGWHDARITARQPFTMDPASPVLHYAQEIFEGMKAYHRPAGGRRYSARMPMRGGSPSPPFAWRCPLARRDVPGVGARSRPCRSRVDPEHR